jgi:steroid 5-alpha reductase family enzyme
MVEIFYYLLISLGINIIMFIPGFVFKTDKLTDLSYSLSFIILIIISAIFSTLSWQKIILLLMIIIWGLRLGIFLFIRIQKMKYDKRFDGIRESFFRFLKFWVLQGLAVFVILLPSIFFMSENLNKICGIGFIIWALGLIIESVADFQKYRFNQKKVNKGKFISTGIWKYSRHPNYFGEMLCWTGIYLFTFNSFNLAQTLIGLISPLFIIILLLFVTGLPPLEKSADLKWGKQKDYKDYKRKTSILIPWFQKK